MKIEIIKFDKDNYIKTYFSITSINWNVDKVKKEYQKKVWCFQISILNYVIRIHSRLDYNLEILDRVEKSLPYPFKGLALKVVEELIQINWRDILRNLDYYLNEYEALKRTFSNRRD
jgi:predicted RecB family nuclease